MNPWFLFNVEPIRFVFKHKPRFVHREDGSVEIVVHPEDAHLLEPNE